MLYGIDVSYAQKNIDWAAVGASGKVAFAYIRACYGSNPAYDDGPLFIANHDGCKAQSIPFGAYMFFLFSDDPVAQAQHFLNLITGKEGEFRPAVDVEELSGSTGSVAGNVAALSAFDAEIQKQLGCLPVIYTNQNTWNTKMGGTNDFAGHTLWVANYPAVPGQPAMPSGFPTWKIHQYSNSGTIPGITTAVDLDVMTALTDVQR
jgi:lysozyme